jgi:hypothetical protein
MLWPEFLLPGSNSNRNNPRESGMTHQDTDGLIRLPRQLQDLKDVLQWLIALADFTRLGFRRDCSWTPTALVFAAWLWSWSDETTLVDRFATATTLDAACSTRSRALEPP